jgi:hypothetical protein
MGRLICRRVVALALAYVLALDLILPLVPAFASGVSATTVAEICATDHSGTRSGGDRPDRQGPICPFGMACTTPGCDAVGLPVDVIAAVAAVSAPQVFLAHADEQAHLLQEVGKPFARAPPLA